MSISKIGYRYARAFYEEASEIGVIDNVLEDMRLISQTLQKNSVLISLLNDPSMASDTKLEILQEIFSKHVKAMTMTFLGFISLKKRINLLQEISRQMEKIHRHVQGVVHFKVVLSPELDKDFADKLVEKISQLTGYKFESEVVVDEELQGGFIYTYEGKVYDYSIKGRLKALSKVLLSS